MSFGWSEIKEVLLMLSSFIVAGGILLVWWQIKKDHERSRREHAAQVIREFIINLDKDTPLSVKLVDNLDISKCTDIYNQNEVKIDKRWQSLVEGCLVSLCNSSQLTIKDDNIILNVGQSSHIRYLALTACNLLEFVFLSWKHSIADSDMIADEFEGLIMKNNGSFILETFRSAAGGKRKFPATAEFIEYLKKKNSPTGKQRGDIV